MAKEITLGLNPAPAPSGVTGQLPLPIGEPVIPGPMLKINPNDLTDDELQTLQQIPGWKPGDGIPANLAEKLAAIQAGISSSIETGSLQPPVPLDTPPLKIEKPIPIEQLSPQKQAELQRFLSEAAAISEMEQETQARTIPGAAPGVNEFLRGETRREILLDDDTQSAAEEIPVTVVAPISTSGADALQLTECPHCHWDLTMPDVPDPDQEDRRNFTQSILGLVQFEKSYPLLDDGSLQVSFRTLQAGEVDCCFKQLYLERESNQLSSVEDFFERLQRYRMCLQITRIQFGAERLFNLPRSLDAWSPNWETEVGQTPLPQIYKKIYSEVITSESLNRILGAALTRFNRTTSKLEAAADRPDFWKETSTAP